MHEGFRHGDYVIGVEGLALLRAGAQRRFARVALHTAGVGQVLAHLEEEPYSSRRDLPVHPVDSGYAGWAASYDDPGNDLIELEQPVVWALLDELPDGPVLDAACGTGRHAARLVSRGREVVGVDASQEMLAHARSKLPGVDLRRGDLDALPVPDGAFAGAVCALALSHLPGVGRAIAELARALRPGGRLVISNPHPFATGVMGWRAVFVDAAGRRSMIPEYPHLHADYVDAFSASGLTVRRCIEPGLTPDQARARAKGSHPDAFEGALTGIPAVLVWELELRGDYAGGVQAEGPSA